MMKGNFHTTKAGPGRQHKDGTYRGGKRGAGSFGKGITASITRKQRDAIQAKARKAR